MKDDKARVENSEVSDFADQSTKDESMKVKISQSTKQEDYEMEPIKEDDDSIHTSLSPPDNIEAMDIPEVEEIKRTLERDDEHNEPQELRLPLTQMTNPFKFFIYNKRENRICGVYPQSYKHNPEYNENIMNWLCFDKFLQVTSHQESKQDFQVQEFNTSTLRFSNFRRFLKTHLSENSKAIFTMDSTAENFNNKKLEQILSRLKLNMCQMTSDEEQIISSIETHLNIRVEELEHNNNILFKALTELAQQEITELIINASNIPESYQPIIWNKSQELIHQNFQKKYCVVRKEHFQEFMEADEEQNSDHIKQKIEQLFIDYNEVINSIIYSYQVAIDWIYLLGLHPSISSEKIPELEKGRIEKIIKKLKERVNPITISNFQSVISKIISIGNGKPSKVLVKGIQEKQILSEGLDDEVKSLYQFVELGELNLQNEVEWNIINTCLDLFSFNRLKLSQIASQINIDQSENRAQIRKQKDSSNSYIHLICEGSIFEDITSKQESNSYNLLNINETFLLSGIQKQLLAQTKNILECLDSAQEINQNPNDQDEQQPLLQMTPIFGMLINAKIIMPENFRNTVYYNPIESVYANDNEESQCKHILQQLEFLLREKNLLNKQGGTFELQQESLNNLITTHQKFSNLNGIVPDQDQMLGKSFGFLISETYQQERPLITQISQKFQNILNHENISGNLNGEIQYLLQQRFIKLNKQFPTLKQLMNALRFFQQYTLYITEKSDFSKFQFKEDLEILNDDSILANIDAFNWMAVPLCQSQIDYELIEQLIEQCQDDIEKYEDPDLSINIQQSPEDLIERDIVYQNMFTQENIVIANRNYTGMFDTNHNPRQKNKSQKNNQSDTSLSTDSASDSGLRDLFEVYEEDHSISLNLFEQFAEYMIINKSQQLANQSILSRPNNHDLKEDPVRLQAPVKFLKRTPFSFKQFVEMEYYYQEGMKEIFFQVLIIKDPSIIASPKKMNKLYNETSFAKQKQQLKDTKKNIDSESIGKYRFRQMFEDNVSTSMRRDPPNEFLQNFKRIKITNGISQ